MDSVPSVFSVDTVAFIDLQNIDALWGALLGLGALGVGVYFLTEFFRMKHRWNLRPDQMDGLLYLRVSALWGALVSLFAAVVIFGCSLELRWLKALQPVAVVALFVVYIGGLIGRTRLRLHIIEKRRPGFRARVGRVRARR